MLFYKRIETDTLTVNKERIGEILTCPKDKQYKIVSITTAPLAHIFLRVYRNAQQIVDIESLACTDGSPLLPMNLPVKVGDVIRAGCYNHEDAATAKKQITIGYEEM